MIKYNNMVTIQQNMHSILTTLPPNVELVVVAKKRSIEELKTAIDYGARIIGENYVQEAERIKGLLSSQVKWHFIGHLQKNKVKKAVQLFDMIETVDSLELAVEIDSRSRLLGKLMPILVEINSGREPNKTGVLPEVIPTLVSDISKLQNVHIMGLMTMGPNVRNAEEIRPYFSLTHQLFEDLKKLVIINVEMKYLSMGMTDSYRIAIEEGANLVRIGRGIFSV